MSILNEVFKNGLVSAILDIGGKMLDKIKGRETVQFYLKEWRLKGDANDFAKVYLETIVDLRLERVLPNILNFYREETYYTAVYKHFYSKDTPYCDAPPKKVLKEVGILSKKPEYQDIKANWRYETQHFWRIFKKNIHESRTVKEVELYQIIHDLQNKCSDINQRLDSFLSEMKELRKEDIQIHNKTYHIGEINEAVFREIENSVININIGKQINIHENGTYNETVINNVEDIRNAIKGWWEGINQQEILVFVICENKQRIEEYGDLRPISNYYGDKCEDWKPFKDKTILELMKEYGDIVSYKVNIIICNGIEIEDLTFWVNLEDNHLQKMIVVTDGLVLSQKAEKLSYSIDYKKSVGGIIVPLHEDIANETRECMRAIVTKKYSRMKTRVSAGLGTPYPNIKIDVQNETRFINELINLAAAIGVISTPPPLSFNKQIQGIEELNSDGSQKNNTY